MRAFPVDKLCNILSTKKWFNYFRARFDHFFWAFRVAGKLPRRRLQKANRIQYNFVKPHLALDGQMPTQAAGINVSGWKDLLKLALQK
jgi:hypothetical protein